MGLSEKFIKKYMRMAKHVGDENDACYSRQLGVVLVKVYEDGSSHVVGSGYNGPPRKTPHCDSKEYLKDIVFPQLTEKDKDDLRKHLSPLMDMSEAFSDKYHDCKICPRKIIGCKTGERTELCSCQHAERNAIYNSIEDLHGCWAFCYCGVPCSDCAGALINVGIKKVYCIEDNSYAHGQGADYSFSARWLLKKAGIELSLRNKEYYLEEVK